MRSCGHRSQRVNGVVAQSRREMTKLIALGSRAPRSIAEVDFEVTAALESGEFEGLALCRSLRPVVAPSPDLDEDTAHFFDVGGPVLSGPAPDCILTVQATDGGGCEDALRSKV